MAISKSTELAHAKRVLKRMKELDIAAKTADMNEQGRQMVTRMFQEDVRKQEDYVRQLEKSK